MPQVWIIGEPSNPRVFLGHGDIAHRNQEGNPAAKAVKGVPSVLEMLVAGGKRECGRDIAFVGKDISVKKAAEAVSEQNDRTPIPPTPKVGEART